MNPYLDNNKILQRERAFLEIFGDSIPLTFNVTWLFRIQDDLLRNVFLTCVYFNLSNVNHSGLMSSDYEHNDAL